MKGNGGATAIGAIAGNAILPGVGGAIGGALIGNQMGGGGALDFLGGGKVAVPGATAQPGWNLSTPDGKLRQDLLLGNQMPKAAGQSQDVLNQLQTRATAQGPSDQAKYLQDANTRNMNNSLDQAEATSRGTMASMNTNLAMRGGLDSGARERIGRANGADTMMNKQRIMNDASGANLNILANDEAQKNQMMQALPSSLLAQAGFEQDNKKFDISNTLGTVGGKYGTDMNAWAANQAAREQAQLANKKTGLLGLGIGGIL